MKIRIILREAQRPQQSHIIEQNIQLIENSIDEAPWRFTQTLQRVFGVEDGWENRAATHIVRNVKTLQTNLLNRFLGKGSFGLTYILDNTHIYKLYTPMGATNTWGRDADWEERRAQRLMHSQETNVHGNRLGSETAIYESGKVPGVPNLNYLETSQVETTAQRYKRTSAPRDTGAQQAQRKRDELETEFLDDLCDLLHYITPMYFDEQDTSGKKKTYGTLMTFTREKLQEFLETGSYPKIDGMMMHDGRYVQKVLDMYVRTAIRLNEPLLDLRQGNFGYAPNDPNKFVFFDP